MRIGISGHQNLGAVTVIDWTRTQMRYELGKRDFSCGLSSLASGADQLFAEVVLSLGKDLEAVIPCHNYEAAFTDSVSLEQFRKLKRKASTSYILDFKEPTEEAFYEGGRRIVELSDLMIFVWDGKPAEGHGGTADIVNYAREAGREHVWINPANRFSSTAPKS